MLSMEKGVLLQTLVADVDASRDELVNQYRKVLQKSLFSNRKEMRPAMLGKIAVEEVDALLDYLQQNVASSIARGEQLCETGLSEISVLHLGQVTRQFLLKHLQDGYLAQALETYDEYHNMVIQGYIQQHERCIIREQVRSQDALLRVHQQTTR